MLFNENNANGCLKKCDIVLPSLITVIRWSFREKRESCYPTVPFGFNLRCFGVYYQLKERKKIHNISCLGQILKGE